MSKKTKKKISEQFDADKWLKKHLEKLVDKYAGEYIVVAEGQIYRGASPSRLRDKAKVEHPKAVILGLRIPQPQDFLCALSIL